MIINNCFISVMKYILIIFLIIFVYSCSPEISKQTETNNVKVIEENNKIVKTISERDSFVIKTKDTTKVIE